MAVITISNTGGNWNSTGTWVGGVIPTTSDSIAATATSGQLTVNVNVSILSFDLSLYTSTLTINSTITLTTTGAGSTSTFGSSMTYSFLGTGTNQGSIAKGANAQTYTMNGTTQIPRLRSTTSTTLTCGSNLYITNFEPGSVDRVNGNDVYVYGNLNYGFSTLVGTSKIRFVGTGTITVLAIGAATTNAELIIDCSGGTATISSQGIGLGNGTNNSNIIFRHLSGTIINPTFRPNFNSSSTTTLDLLSGTTWDLYGILQLSPATISLTNPSYFDKFQIFLPTGNQVSILNLSGNNFFINELNPYNALQNQGGTYYRAAADIAIQTGITVNIAQFIDINGGSNEPNPAQTPNLEIRSQTAGVQATLNVNTFAQYVSRTRFTDINCSGGNTLYGQNLTLSNTTNITQYTLPPSAGGGETSSVFIS